MLMVVLSAHGISVLLRKCFPVPVSARLFPRLPFNDLCVSCSTLSSLIHSELSFMQGEKGRSVWVLLCSRPLRPALFVTVAVFIFVFSPVCIFGLFIKIQVSIGEGTCG